MGHGDGIASAWGACALRGTVKVKACKPALRAVGRACARGSRCGAAARRARVDAGGTTGTDAAEPWTGQVGVVPRAVAPPREDDRDKGQEFMLRGICLAI